MIRKIFIDIAQVLGALVVLGVLTFLAYRGSDSLLLLFAVAIIGAAGMLVFYLWRAVLRGELPGRFGSITYRHSSPIGFWFQIGFYGLFAMFLFFNGLALLGLAPHWYIVMLRSMHSHNQAIHGHGA